MASAVISGTVSDFAFHGMGFVANLNVTSGPPPDGLAAATVQWAGSSEPDPLNFGAGAGEPSPLLPNADSEDAWQALDDRFWFEAQTGVSYTAFGIYRMVFTATGLDNDTGAQLTATFAKTIIIEGYGWLAGYHLDWSGAEPRRREAIDIQYDLAFGALRSVAIGTRTSLFTDLSHGFEIGQRETVRIHVMVATGRLRSNAAGELNLAPAEDFRLRIGPPGQPDAPAWHEMELTGEELMEIPGGGENDVPYFDLTLDSARVDRLFRQLNAPHVAVAESAALDAEMRIELTLDGGTVFLPAVPLRIRQPN